MPSVHALTICLVLTCLAGSVLSEWVCPRITFELAGRNETATCCPYEWSVACRLAPLEAWLPKDRHSMPRSLASHHWRFEDYYTWLVNHFHVANHRRPSSHFCGGVRSPREITISFHPAQ